MKFHIPHGRWVRYLNDPDSQLAYHVIHTLIVNLFMQLVYCYQQCPLNHLCLPQASWANKQSQVTTWWVFQSSSPTTGIVAHQTVTSNCSMDFQPPVSTTSIMAHHMITNNRSMEFLLLPHASPSNDHKLKKSTDFQLLVCGLVYMWSIRHESTLIRVRYNSHCKRRANNYFEWFGFVTASPIIHVS